MKLSLKKTFFYCMGLGLAGFAFAEPDAYKCTAPGVSINWSTTTLTGQPSLHFKGPKYVFLDVRQSSRTVDVTKNDKKDIKEEVTSAGKLVSFTSEAVQLREHATTTVTQSFLVPPIIIDGVGGPATSFDSVLISTSQTESIGRLIGPQIQLKQVTKLKCAAAVVTP